MPRFYINDGVRPGRRSPATDYATKIPGVGSDVLNEAQAIARGRKLTPTAGAVTGYTDWRISLGRPSAGAALIEMAEIEMFVDGVNVAAQATITSSQAPGWGTNTASLVDGNKTPLNTQTSLFWEVYSAADGWAHLDFHFPTPKNIDEIKLWQTPQDNSSTWTPSQIRVSRGPSPANLTQCYEHLLAPPPWPTAHWNILVPATPVARLVPTAFGTSGNYNGTYDINGVDPNTGVYTVHALNDGGFADPASWRAARVGTTTNPHWVGFDFGASKNLASYEMFIDAGSVQYGIVPPKWRVEGSNSGWSGPWTTLDDRTVSAHNWAVGPSSFAARISGSYRYLRVYIPPFANPYDSTILTELNVFGS